MSIQPLVLTAMLLSPIATIADEYQHQRRYSIHRTYYKEIFKEQYVAGERSSKGYVKSNVDKVEVPCSSLSWHSPIRKYHYLDNHIHYFNHTHRRHYKPTHKQVLVSRSYRTSGRVCNSGNATTARFIGGSLAAAISKKDAYAWLIPLETLPGIEIANIDC